MFRFIQKRTFLTVINQGEVGYRLSFGRNPVRIEPGLRLSIPIYHSVKRVDVREGSLPINDLIAFTSDNVPVTLEGSLFYQVRNPYDACFNVQEYKTSIHRIGTSSMRSLIGTFDYDSVIGDRNKINKGLQEIIGNTIEKWGVDCTRFEIQKFEPANKGIQKQLEQQMEAERNRRKQLLDTEAHVNVADGMKRKTILESEGMLEASKNRAQGSYIQTTKDAEARRNALALEAEGLRQQVDTLSESFDGDTFFAMKMLLEMKRIEQLKAIADGKNNTIYFTRDPNINDSEGVVVDFIEKMKRDKGLEM